MSRIPAGVPKPAPDRETDHFITSAPGKNNPRAGMTNLPWKAPTVRDDVLVNLHIKQAEPIYLKLDWYAFQSGRTKREIVETALAAYLDPLIRRQGIEP